MIVRRKFSQTALFLFVFFVFVLASLCYAQGRGTDADPAARAIEPSKEPEEPSTEQKAKAGDRDAQNELGKLAQGTQNYAEAFKWYELAAKQGLSDAQVNLGILYDKGLGVKKDPLQAAKWYALAAALGDPAGEFDIGLCYLNGDGVAKNRELAVQWFTKSMKHEDKDDDKGESANGIGMAYEFGLHDDKEKNYAEAFRWYLKAAEIGFGEAQFNVCRLTAQGLVATAASSEGKKWCSQVANSGGKSSDWGQYGMGQIYKDGIGVPQDYKEAAKWYQKSAEQGNPPAQLELAQLYADGKGVKANLIEAYMWTAIAGSEKHTHAPDYLQQLTSRMTEHEIAEAQARVRKWIQEHPLDPEMNIDNIFYKPQ